MGMRALVERDANTTDGNNEINERRYLYYNAAWQIPSSWIDEEHVDAGVTAANAAASLTSPTIDRIVQNIWGLRYIDDLVLRRVDANYPGSGLPNFSQTTSGDIDWEQYLTDHQFSVVAAVGRTGTLAFRVAYDAYGEARHLPAKDINGDGKVDSADTAIAQAAVKKRIGEPGYNPDADWDRDGIVSTRDIAQFGSRSYIAALPQGQLAQPGGATQPAAGDVSPSADLARAANARSDFNIGYCGYRFNGDIGAYTVRFRHYDPTPGMCRWLERDPAGYQDGPSLYSYLGRNPMAGTDPSGRWFWIAAGAAVGGGASIAVDLWNGHEIDWSRAGKAAVAGAIGGAMFQPWAGVVTAYASGGFASAAVSTAVEGGVVSGLYSGFTYQALNYWEGGDFNPVLVWQEGIAGGFLAGTFQAVYGVGRAGLGAMAAKRTAQPGSVARPGASATAAGADQTLSREAEKGISSLQKRIAEHELKLLEFKESPTVRPGMEGLPEEFIKRQQVARIRHLEAEIRAFKQNIEKLRRGCDKQWLRLEFF
jgi:RHS repeat-associated protein